MRRVLRFSILLPCWIGLLMLPAMKAQKPAEAPSDVPVAITEEKAPDSSPSPTATQDKRIFGIIPNYRTAESSQVYEPITTKQKFTIAAKDSFDWPGFLVAAGFSGLAQINNTHPSFGQGLEGYAKRYATAYADQVIGNMMTEGIIPTLLHEDPRYFHRGSGGFWGRLGYASTRILVDRSDKGNWRFNASEILGNGITASIANAYYPDSRGFQDTMQRFGTQVGVDALSNVLKEFWPDVKRHYLTGTGHRERAD